MASTIINWKFQKKKKKKRGERCMPAKGIKPKIYLQSGYLIVQGFNETSIPVGYFVSSHREREKRDRRDGRRNEREGQGRKRKQE